MYFYLNRPHNTDAGDDEFGACSRQARKWTLEQAGYESVWLNTKAAIYFLPHSFWTGKVFQPANPRGTEINFMH